MQFERIEKEKKPPGHSKHTPCRESDSRYPPEYTI